MDTHEHAADERFRKVEDRSGVGAVSCAGVTYEQVRYDIARFQGMTRAGLPVPGVHRLEGRLEFAHGAVPADVVGKELSLALQDGSRMELELLDEDGRVVAHGHGPGRCGCC